MKDKGPEECVCGLLNGESDRLAGERERRVLLTGYHDLGVLFLQV